MKYPFSTLVFIIFIIIFFSVVYVTVDLANIPHYDLTAWIFWLLVFNTIFQIYMALFGSRKESKPEPKLAEAPAKQKKKKWPLEDETP